METPLRAFLWVSLIAHVAVGAMILGHGRRPDGPPSADRHDVTSNGAFESTEREVSVGTEGLRDEGSLLGSSPSTVGLPKPPTLPTREEGRRHEKAAGQGRGARDGAMAEGANAVFGALRDRAAVDLATAFTRGFPQAASADPAWITAPFGGAGEAVVTLRIDRDGALVGVEVQGTPSPALRAGIARTIALLRGRAFTANGPVTRLRIVAKIAPDEVHDGLHGEVFAIGGSFATTQGSAFFALAVGRRIDVQVERAR